MKQFFPKKLQSSWKLFQHQTLVIFSAREVTNTGGSERCDELWCVDTVGLLTDRNYAISDSDQEQWCHLAQLQLQWSMQGMTFDFIIVYIQVANKPSSLQSEKTYLTSWRIVLRSLHEMLCRWTSVTRGSGSLTGCVSWHAFSSQ